MTNAAANLPLDPSSFAAIGWIIVALGGLMLFLERGAKFLDRFKERPTPSETYVTKEVCRATMDGQATRIARLEEDVRGIKEELRGMRKDFSDGLQRINTDAEARASRLHQRIEKLLVNPGHDHSTD